jgi:hypothetical protein
MPLRPTRFTDTGDDEELPSELDDQSLKEVPAEPLFDNYGCRCIDRMTPRDPKLTANRPSIQTTRSLCRAVLL